MPAENSESSRDTERRQGRASAARRTRRRKTIFTCLFAAAFLLVAGNLLASCAVVHTDRCAERDPATAILRGAESRDLGPADARVAVLLIHGFAGATNNFADLPERLAVEGFRVRAMRLPGHGTSPRNLRRTTAADLIAAVTHEVDTLGSRHAKVIVVGHSMGGALGTLAVAQGHADGLVLGAPYFGITRRWYYILPPETWIRIGSPFVRWVYKGRLFLQVNRKEAKKDIVCYNWLPSKAGVTLSEIGVRANKQEVLDQVTCPVLLLHGRDDVAASPEAARRAFEAVASGEKRAVWLERSNHHIFWDYDREQVMQEVVAFVRHVADGA